MSMLHLHILSLIILQINVLFQKVFVDTSRARLNILSVLMHADVRAVTHWNLKESIHILCDILVTLLEALRIAGVSTCFHISKDSCSPVSSAVTVNSVCYCKTCRKFFLSLSFSRLSSLLRIRFPE
jgi:hypothetical protein